MKLFPKQTTVAQLFFAKLFVPTNLELMQTGPTRHRAFNPRSTRPDPGSGSAVASAPADRCATELDLKDLMAIRRRDRGVSSAVVSEARYRSRADRELRAFAEDAYAHIGAKPWQTVLDADQFYLKHSDVKQAMGGVATRIRMGEEFERRVPEVKTWFKEHGRHSFVWMIGPSATPEGIGERLLAQGASPLPGFETTACMILLEAPKAAAGDFAVRKLETLADYEERADVAAAAFGWGADYRDSTKRLIREHWDALDAARTETFGVFAEGRLVAFGASLYTDTAVFLDGGATLPEARGAGAYRALVRARWEEAVWRKTPALVVHAGPMSRPILEQLGFQTVCELYALQDSC